MSNPNNNYSLENNSLFERIMRFNITGPVHKVFGKFISKVSYPEESESKFIQTSNWIQVADAKVLFPSGANNLSTLLFTDEKNLADNIKKAFQKKYGKKIPRIVLFISSLGKYELVWYEESKDSNNVIRYSLPFTLETVLFKKLDNESIYRLLCHATGHDYHFAGNIIGLA